MNFSLQIDTEGLPRWLVKGWLGFISSIKPTARSGTSTKLLCEKHQVWPTHWAKRPLWPPGQLRPSIGPISGHTAQLRNASLSLISQFVSKIRTAQAVRRSKEQNLLTLCIFFGWVWLAIKNQQRSFVNSFHFHMASPKMKSQYNINSIANEIYQYTYIYIYIDLYAYIYMDIYIYMHVIYICCICILHIYIYIYM